LAIVVLLSDVGDVFSEENETLGKAIDWLVAQQDESGAFKSKHYGAMKQGAAMTSLALYSLSMTSSECHEEHHDVIEKAFQFLLPGTKARGRVANPDGSLDHPVYSTAMLLVAAKRLDYELDADLVATLLDYLVAAQCVEGRGFDSTNPNYGGWDVIGPDIMPRKTSGTNVSVARFVLEAFASHVPVKEATNEAGKEDAVNIDTAKRINESRKYAIGWLNRLHKNSSDDGFQFSAQPGSALNKARSADDKPKSYASATCDGFLALHFTGESKTLSSAANWIRTYGVSNDVAGFEEQKDSSWPKALQFYHLQSLATASKSIGDSVELLSEIDAVLGESQLEDGRFQNESALMRENDPLIATCFAIMALSQIGDSSE